MMMVQLLCSENIVRNVISTLALGIKILPCVLGLAITESAYYTLYGTIVKFPLGL